MILRKVRCSWASIQEPNTKFEHAWEVVATLDEQQAADLANHGFKLKEDDNGNPTYRFKRKCKGKKKTGEEFDKKAPFCVDASNNPFEKLVGNGSLVNIQYSVKDVTFMGNNYINGDLEGMQVLEHVAFGEDNQFEDEGTTDTIESTTPTNEMDSADNDSNPY